MSKWLCLISLAVSRWNKRGGPIFETSVYLGTHLLTFSSLFKIFVWAGLWPLSMCISLSMCAHALVTISTSSKQAGFPLCILCLSIKVSCPCSLPAPSMQQMKVDIRKLFSPNSVQVALQSAVLSFKWAWLFLHSNNLKRNRF